MRINNKKLKNRKKLLLDFVSNKEYQPMRAKDIAMLLQIPKGKRSELFQVLDELEAEGKIIEKIRRTGTTKNKLRSGAAHGRIIPIGRWKLPESRNESTTAVISDRAFRKSPRCIWALPRSKWKSAA